MFLLVTKSLKNFDVAKKKMQHVIFENYFRFHSYGSQEGVWVCKGEQVKKNWNILNFGPLSKNSSILRLMKLLTKTDKNVRNFDMRKYFLSFLVSKKTDQILSLYLLSLRTHFCTQNLFWFQFFVAQYREHNFKRGRIITPNKKRATFFFLRVL